MHGISRLPCSKSDEQQQLPFIRLIIDPPRLINIEHIEEISKGTCPTTAEAPEINFVVATACGSYGLQAHIYNSVLPRYMDYSIWFDKRDNHES